MISPDVSKKKLQMIRDVIELIAPFCEESVLVPDIHGNTPVQIVQDRGLKALLDELFTTFEVSHS